MKPLGVVTLIAVLLLSGCATMPESRLDQLVTSDVDPDSVPAFVDTPQQPTDLIDAADVDVESWGVDPGSLRFQGVWDDKNVYLGVAGTSNVTVVTGVPGDRQSWGSGSTGGNAVIGLAMDAESGLQYLPQGTDVVPDGWSALSDYVIVLD